MVSIELEYVALMVITLAVMFIGVNILFTVFSGSGVTDFIFDGMSKFVGRIFSGRAYNICEDFNGKELTLEQFQSLLQAMDREECGSAQIRIRFSLTENDLKKIVSLIGSDKTLLILEGAARPFGANSILVYGNPGPRPLKRDDKLELVRAGTPRPDIMITLLEQGCDPTDDDCDASCSYKSGVCDPLCYKHNQLTGEQCDIDCVDKNGDGVPDSDGICDLDCYNNKPDPNNAYDPDCIKARQQNDNVCDPDSNGVQDGVCDPDCVGDNFICDPDCDGQAGRPYDRECYECDGACNNFCSRVCITGEDPDCAQGFGSKTACCGNNKCELEAGEICSSCADCPPGATCKGLYTGKIQQGSDAICCPQGDTSDEYGCGIYKIDLKEGEKCSCDAQCQQIPTPLKCQESTDPPKLPGTFCCPDGKQWDGTACVVPKIFKFAVVAVNYDDMNAYRSRAQARMQTFVDKSPFKECPSSADIVILNANCQCSDYRASNCPTNTINCARGALLNEKGENLDDFDYIVVAFTDDLVCNGYSVGPTPFVICGGGIGQLDEICIAHEIGHQFKLCDQYSRSIFSSQDSRFRSWRLLQESTPYAGCGHIYPLNNGIGAANDCANDCSINNQPCQSGTCGVKISGTAPPYRTSIMGGGGNIGPPLSCPFTNMAGIPTAHEQIAYDFIKARLQEAGYCL